MLDTVFAALQEAEIINIPVVHVSMDSTAVKVHPEETGALKTSLNLSVRPWPDACATSTG